MASALVGSSGGLVGPGGGLVGPGASANITGPLPTFFRMIIIFAIGISMIAGRVNL